MNRCAIFILVAVAALAWARQRLGQEQALEMPKLEPGQAQCGQCQSRFRCRQLRCGDSKMAYAG